MLAPLLAGSFAAGCQVTLHTWVPCARAGDLFDFDLEVEPILEVLVGKVLEQGLMEVLQEEELAAMRRHQVGGHACIGRRVHRGGCRKACSVCGTGGVRAQQCIWNQQPLYNCRAQAKGWLAPLHPQAHFESVRAAELVAAQRLEAAERRKLEERERRLRQVGWGPRQTERGAGVLQLVTWSAGMLLSQARLLTGWKLAC